jgi:NADH:ubiquinone oxidoreductase subunit F (NADH-binding)/(2Fe-2S) ferredoxin/NAD-dependent dihydropyrimidine dehydrogenase PreA subunit
MLRSVEEFDTFQKEIMQKRDSTRRLITICNGTGCNALKGREITELLTNELKKQGVIDVTVLATGCHGFCEQGPIMVIRPEGIFYKGLKPEHVERIVSETIQKGILIPELLYIDPHSGKPLAYEKDIPFYSNQNRLLFGHNEHIDPTSIEDYISIGGYKALVHVLRERIQPKKIIDIITASGLRGRGGAGFPTGRKWESAYKAQSKDNMKYVICNADEGDPGAYANRSLLEGNPHSVLEGMLIGAYAIGAPQGYIYARAEYPLAVQYFSLAIKRAREVGLLGENILGSGFSFDVKVAKGGGAFVCGESTALMASIEGKPGEPRVKHIHTTTSGLWERPTVLNNVETWANVPPIINNGADWYRGIGTEGSKGTKIFSLVGKINNTGLVEVPMGITLRDVIFKIGGGIKQGKKFKAIQIGGPSGGCIPEEKIDLPIDYDSLTDAGAMMGSGGMIVMDENTCMVDVAKYFVNFLMNESCGKCTPCREGLTQMNGILTEIIEGRGTEEHLRLLEELSEVVKETSLCQLGATAPNPVLTTLRYFRDEYEAHIKDKRCPAHVCKPLITYRVNATKCTGCQLCAKRCPVGAVSGAPKQAHSINQSTCIKCGICYDSCKFDALEVQ